MYVNSLRVGSSPSTSGVTTNFRAGLCGLQKQAPPVGRRLVGSGVGEGARRDCAAHARLSKSRRKKVDLVSYDQVAVPEELDNAVQKQMVQWYPGHIARAERQIQEQLSMVDVVFEVRDARIPLSTFHPKLPEWGQRKPRIILLNRKDMISASERAAWTKYFSQTDVPFAWTDGVSGDGILRVTKACKGIYDKINRTRTKRGLRPRSVRACMVGFPNIGKSALINRLSKKRVVESAARPGVTRSLRWVRVADDFDLLDAPGIIPMNMRDQSAAERLAMCNDIGQASYVDSLVAAALVEHAMTLPSAEELREVFKTKYGEDPAGVTGESYIQAFGDRLFQGDAERAGVRLLTDFRAMRLGKWGLETPEMAGGKQFF